MEKMEKMEKMDKTASQKKRSQYRKHFLPEKKKAKIQEREKIMRSFEHERKAIEKETPAPPPLWDHEDPLNKDIGDRVSNEAVSGSTKKQKISKMDEERNRRIDVVTKSEKEKVAKQHSESKRKLKNKLARKRTAKGNVVMKHVIGGLLEKIQKEKGQKK